ncbi:TVP38/TMEM64 family protein [Mongoliitalea daihaiensis]|uniref:TVP38/TMEM64 family protein n=1 Tax=Mongoliitalea daihaiensis TaxID=2782006 RepID=UPI001F29BA71|nr:VTT domain-containing protein [Mongoliitalea daihaiensis]UJP65010.1 VTT domain-containing protein [Mongoliitalea daihaiensis]
MTKMTGIIKEFKTGIQKNLFLGLAVLWVSVMPSIGTLTATPVMLTHVDFIRQFPWSSPLSMLTTCLILVCVMGIALLPTTMVAVFSGFLFGWQMFPWLILSYASASLIGYAWGKFVTKDGLNFLINRYPKVSVLLESHAQNLPQLIFFIRISPVIPFALSNLLFAFLKTGWKKLLVWGTLGMFPRTLLAFYTGTLANDLYDALYEEDSLSKWLLFLVFLGISTFGIWKIFTSRKQKQSNSSQV